MVVSNADSDKDESNLKIKSTHIARSNIQNVAVTVDGQPFFENSGNEVKCYFFNDYN